MPIGMPGWPLFAASTASIASARMAFAIARGETGLDIDAAAFGNDSGACAAHHGYPPGAGQHLTLGDLRPYHRWRFARFRRLAVADAMLDRLAAALDRAEAAAAALRADRDRAAARAAAALAAGERTLAALDALLAPGAAR